MELDYFSREDARPDSSVIQKETDAEEEDVELDREDTSLDPTGIIRRETEIDGASTDGDCTATPRAAQERSSYGVSECVMPNAVPPPGGLATPTGTV